MRFPSPLLPGTLIRRYKRFLADVALDTGETVTAHCANPGSMLGLAMPGLRVWLSDSGNPARKLRLSWELVEVDMGAGPTLVGINTARPNGIAAEAIGEGAIAGLAGYGTVRREVRYGTNSRIDLLLEAPERPACYVEVKNVHLMREPGLAEFPDSVTTRGARHLDELAAVVAAGKRAAMLYLVQRPDAHRLAFARDIDPGYGEAFDRAAAGGVEAFAYACEVTPEGVSVSRRLDIAG